MDFTTGLSATGFSGDLLRVVFLLGVSAIKRSMPRAEWDRNGVAVKAGRHINLAQRREGIGRNR
jgi:hypothetical protein